MTNEEQKEQKKFKIEKVEKTTDEEVVKTRTWFDVVGRVSLGIIMFTSFCSIMGYLKDDPSFDFNTVSTFIGGVANLGVAQKFFYDAIEMSKRPTKSQLRKSELENEIVEVEKEDEGKIR